MSDALIILNARHIEPVKAALAELPIAKIWLTGYTELEISNGVFADAIASTSFDRYLVSSDDILIRPHALAAVIDVWERGYDVVTGYSQRSHTDWTVNLTEAPIQTLTPGKGAYRFREYADVAAWPDPIVPTWFAGFSITGMPRDLWERFPFGCFHDGINDPGHASDFHLSLRLQEAGIPIGAAREGFAYHWRHGYGYLHPDDARLLLGDLEQGITVEEPVAA